MSDHFCSLPSLQQLLNCGSDLGDLVSRWEEADYFSLGVYEEFGEVPGDDLGRVVLAAEERAVGAEEAVDRVRVRPIDFHLLEEGELRAKAIGDELDDFLGRAAFLTEELVAGERQEFEAFLPQFVVHLRQELVVGGGQSSLACHVHHQDCLTSAVLLELHRLAPDVLGL
jgi:hypothetical protein